MEDVYYLFEKLDTCDNDNDNIVNSYYSIGRTDREQKSISQKMYIRPFEKCSICMDKIQTKRNAFLTDCGHTFHRKCLANYTFHKRLQKYNYSIKCPLCRCNLGVPVFYERYPCIADTDTDTNIENINFLDRLENYEMNDNNDEYLHICYQQNLTTPTTTTTTTTNNKSHFLGVKKDCNSCLQYRKNGCVSY